MNRARQQVFGRRLELGIKLVWMHRALGAKLVPFEGY